MRVPAPGAAIEWTINPSAPMPRCRSHSERASAARSADAGTSVSGINRKSLPYACALITVIPESVSIRVCPWPSVASLRAERQQVPAEAPHPRPRQRVERADEERVEHEPLPSAVEPRLHGKALLHDPNAAEAGQQAREL